MLAWWDWMRDAATTWTSGSTKTCGKKIPFAVETRNLSGDIYVYSAGFDCQIMAYSAKKEKVVKTVSIKEVLPTFKDIIQKPMIAPHVYSLNFDNKKEILLASLETGNVIGFGNVDMSRKLFCLEGHNNKVVRRLINQRVLCEQQRLGANRFGRLLLGSLGCEDNWRAP